MTRLTRINLTLLCTLIAGTFACRPAPAPERSSTGGDTASKQRAAAVPGSAARPAKTPAKELTQVHVGNVFINSAAALEKMRGVTELDGDLVIEHTTDVEDLSPLWALRTVRGRVVIRGNRKLKSPGGMNGVRTIREELVIEHNDVMTSLKGLDGLRAVGSLIVRHNRALESGIPLFGIKKLGWRATIEHNGAMKMIPKYPNPTLTFEGPRPSKNASAYPKRWVDAVWMTAARPPCPVYKKGCEVVRTGVLTVKVTVGKDGRVAKADTLSNTVRVDPKLMQNCALKHLKTLTFHPPAGYDDHFTLKIPFSTKC